VATLMKTILFIFFGLTIVACSERQTKKDLKNQDGIFVDNPKNNQDSIFIDNPKNIENILNDSIQHFKLTNIEKKIVRQLVIDSLFYTVEDISFLLRNVGILTKHQFNDKILIEVNHRNNLGNTKAIKEIDPRATDLILFEKETGIILANYRLIGCHYNSYDVKVIDWDNDGTSEIFAQLSYPTQSVPVIDNFFDIIEFDPKDKKLKKTVTLDTDNRDCHFANGTEVGIQTITKYSFIAKKKLKIVKKYFSFNCDNFEFDKPILNKHMDSTRVQTIAWDSSKFEYK
jgi:hypothetical protein